MLNLNSGRGSLRFWEFINIQLNCLSSILYFSFNRDIRICSFNVADHDSMEHLYVLHHISIVQK